MLWPCTRVFVDDKALADKSLTTLTLSHAFLFVPEELYVTDLQGG